MELQFAWGSDHAVMDSFLLGTSPEFDLTIYTVCALANVGVRIFAFFFEAYNLKKKIRKLNTCISFQDCQFTKSGNGVDLTVKTLSVSGVTVVGVLLPMFFYW